jgi:UV DNA damage endonuclease
MKIGYPCINRAIGCQGNKTFRLKSYSRERLAETVDSNLDCLLEILRFNLKHDILFFRITSDLVPFASHPVCRFNWQDHFKPKLRRIGDLVRKNRMRISMHPDQFTLINSRDRKIFKRSRKELMYHCQVLDLMGLDLSAKVQIHLGGVYGDKRRSKRRFAQRFEQLDPAIRRRLAIENDDRNFTLRDCLDVHQETGVPVILDTLHHQANSSGGTVEQVLPELKATWRKYDGLPMIDYSSQEKGKRKGKHAESIDLRDFNRLLRQTQPFDFDVMLEIKDKEKSALKAAKAAAGDRRFCEAVRREEHDSSEKNSTP